MTHNEKINHMKTQIKDIGIVLRRQLISDGFTNVTQELAEKAVINGISSIRDELVASKCPSCGELGNLRKTFMQENGKKYPVVSCEKCIWWG